MPGCFIINSQHLLNLTSYNIIINFFREKDASTDVVNTESTAFTNNENSLSSTHINDVVIGGAFDSENSVPAVADNALITPTPPPHSQINESTDNDVFSLNLPQFSDNITEAATSRQVTLLNTLK
jgi:hypothetical protein